jgi:hypothetical protein
VTLPNPWDYPVLMGEPRTMIPDSKARLGISSKFNSFFEPRPEKERKEHRKVIYK